MGVGSVFCCLHPIPADSILENIMRKMFVFAVLAVIATLLPAQAPQGQQTQPAAQPEPSHPYFDLAGSFYKTFSTSTTGHGTVQKPTDSEGGMFEMRYIKSTFIGGEISYGYNPANQSYSPAATNCGYICNAAPESVTSNANELAFNWVFSKTKGNLRPFAVAGVGFVFTVGTGNAYAVNTSVKPAYVYGAGTDWALGPRFGIRAQLRGNLYSAPATTFAYPATGQFESVIEPAIGIYFRP